MSQQIKSILIRRTTSNLGINRSKKVGRQIETNSVCVELNSKNSKIIKEKEKFIPKKAFSNNICPQKFNFDSHPFTAIEEFPINKNEGNTHRIFMKLNRKTTNCKEKTIINSNLITKSKHSYQTPDIQINQKLIIARGRVIKIQKEKKI